MCSRSRDSLRQTDNVVINSTSLPHSTTTSCVLMSSAVTSFLVVLALFVAVIVLAFVNFLLDMYGKKQTVLQRQTMRAAAADKPRVVGGGFGFSRQIGGSVPETRIKMSLMMNFDKTTMI